MKFCNTLVAAVFLSFFLEKTAHSQTVQIMPVLARDLVYDPITDRIYASVDPQNAIFGNTIGIIDPHTATFDTAVFIGSQPTKLAISDNGAVIYAALDGNGKVRRFDVASKSAGASFSLGTSAFNGPNYVEDMEVMPGETTKLAISRRNSCCSPAHEGVAFFDNGVQRPNTTQVHTGSNMIAFAGADALFGLCTESSEFGFREIGIANDGLAELWVQKDFVGGYNQDFIVHNKVAYFTNGKVVNLAGPSIDWLGTFSGASGKVAFDALANRAAYVKTDIWGGSGPVSIERFNPDLFTSTGVFSTGVTGKVRSLICWGNGRYAFNTVEGEVAIIDLQAVGTDQPGTDIMATAWPNPATGQVELEWAGDAVDLVSVKTVTGRTVFSKKNEKGARQLSIETGTWPAGPYFIEYRLSNGQSVCKKLIKI